MKKFSICLIAAIFFLNTACDDFLDINVSPNEPAKVDVQLVLPAAIGSSAYIIGGWYQILGGIWSQHWTQSTGASQYRDIDSYDLQSDKFDSRQYSEMYAGALNDLQYVRETSKADQNWSYYLMSTVIQCYTFQVLADLYDKVPFTEALEGEDGNLTPKFDDGQLIYDSLIARLDYALGKDLNALTAISPGKDDVIFQGKMEKWVKFANTLKLKIFMRQSSARTSVAQAGIQALFANPNFLIEDASFKAFKAEQDNRNPVYETGVDRLAGNLTISRTLFQYLDDNADPRRDSLISYPKNTPSTHNTLLQGDYLLSSPTNILGLSTPNLKPLDPVYFISAAESAFLQAEAVVRFGVAGNAKTLYEKGIDASFEKLKVAASAAPLYEAGGAYEFPSAGSDEDKINSIITQKWISMVNSQGLESFFEQNRTGFPNFYTIAKNNVTSDKFPRRLIYPQSERLRNPSNVPEIKPLTAPVWWAKSI